MVLFFQIIVNPNLSHAKPIDTLGRVFNVQDFIDASGADDELGIKRCLTTAAMQNHNQVKAHITILFPARVYQISGSLYPVWNLNEKAFYMRPDITNHIGRYAQINILGLTVDNATLKSDLGSMISGSFQTYINGTSWVPYDTSSQANYLPLNYHNYGYTTSDSATEIAIKNYINSKIGQTTIQHNVSTPVSSATFLTMPNPTIAVEIQSNNPNNHHFFVIDGAGKAGTSYYPGTYVPNPVYGLPSIPPSPPNNGELYNTAINIAGFRLKGIDTGNNSHIYSDTLIQHDSTFNMGKAICLENFKSYYIDNNIIEDVYGTGINISNKLFSYINGPVEVHHNLIKNVWGLVYKPIDTISGLYDHTGDGINFQGLKDGICQYNIVINNVSVTRQFGRVGIGACSEHTMNTECSYNMASGYDRGIHIENGLGGYKIHHNRLTGSETGIVFDGNPSYRSDTFETTSPLILHQCPFFNPSYIHHNYISNVPDVTYSFNHLIKLYLPELIWASHANASNEHRGTIIEDNELVIDKNFMRNYVECNTAPLLCRQTRKITFNQPRYHIQSGLREQKILCNEFKVLNSTLYPSFHAGGTALYSEPGRVNYRESHPSCYSSFDPVLPNDTINGPDSTRLIFDLQFNHYIDCRDTLWMLWINNSAEQQARIAMNTFNVNPPCKSNMSLYNSISFYTNTNSNTNISCCRQPNQLGMKNLYNTKSSYLHYALSNKTFFVNGTYTIDQSTTFTNCTFYLATSAKITVAAGQTLTLNGCTLKAGCNAMWDGIYAADPSAEIVIENGSTLQDMEHGVVISNQGKLNATGSAFKDNYISIHLKNLPATYTGIIENCNFEKANGLLAPKISVVLPKHGIVVENCKHVIIGNSTSGATQNTFTDLWNGIYLNYHAEYIYQNTTQTVELYYNKFLRIAGGVDFDPPVSPRDDNMFINPDGCAIFGNNNRLQNTIQVYVIGNDVSTNILNFDKCNKAVILNAMNANIARNKTFETNGGFLFNRCDGKNIQTRNNYLDGVRIGINKTGNGQDFHNDNNTIKLASNLYSVGVNSVYYNTANVGKTRLYGNNIELPNTDYAQGIHLLNGSDDDMQLNEITFTNTSTTSAITAAPTLLGIKLVNNKSAYLNSNTILGQNDPNFFDHRSTAALYLHKNLLGTYDCNISHHTQFGMYIVGNNSTGSYDKLKNNLFETRKACLLFRHLSNEGTLGDIGFFQPSPLYAYDGNNKYYNQASSSLNKIYRFTTCSAPTFDKIVTQSSNLVQSESGSNFTSSSICNVQVPPTANFDDIYLCNPPNTNNFACDATVPNTDFHDVEIAIGIAEHNIQYNEFPDGGRWLDEQMLYDWLNRDTTIRYSSPILDSFYLANASGDLEKLWMVDDLIAQLTDSVNLENTSYWTSLIQTAYTENNNIQSSEVFTNNEKWINNKYLNYLDLGLGNLTQEDFEDIETMANACPYIDGTAVFKARTLYAMFVPAVDYDDMAICNSIGVYKGGKSLYELENESLNGNGKTQNVNATNNLRIYPNPASTSLTIEFPLNESDTAAFTICDLTGKIIQVETLLYPINEIVLKNICRGFYIYLCSIQGRNIYTGKLIID